MDEVDTMFVAKTPAWHSKGNVLENVATAAQAIQSSGLTWKVLLRPVSVGGIILQDKLATQRDDNQAVLGIVSKRYHPVQNNELFHFFDNVVRDDAAIYHAGGSLRRGEIVWLLAKLSQSFYVLNDDKVDSYILLCAGHNGKLSVLAKHTSVRVVCMNTLQIALNGRESMVRIRHTDSAVAQLREAHRVLGIASRRSSAFKEIAQALLGKSVTSKVLRNMVQHALPTRRDDKSKNVHLEPVEMLFAESDTNNLPGMEGTGWAAYNALTQYIDHAWASRGDALYRTWLGSGGCIADRSMSLSTDSPRKDG